MLWKAKNGSIRIGNTEMYYVSFGTGLRPLVMLPGLGDGLTTVKGMALPLAMTYRMYARDYKVYVFSRKNALEEGYSTKDMADDQAKAMKTLGLTGAKVLGVSQGGMIAQYLAIDYPELVDRLVLAVTSSRPNDLIRASIQKWMMLAGQNDYKSLMIDTAEKSYSEKRLKLYRIWYPVLEKMEGPKDFSRFLTQAASCLCHNAYEELDKIVCPVLIIGGEQDKIVGADASRELAGKVKKCELFLYNELGHAAYEEAKDFNRRVLKFFLQ